MTRLLIILFSVVLLAACSGNKLPEGETYEYAEGEVVYYKIDNMPMIVKERLYKNGRKMYNVYFKDENGFIVTSEVFEHELVNLPPQFQSSGEE